MKRYAVIVLLALGCGDDDVTKSRAELLDPQTCKKCHPDHFREWSGSMHAYASDDPLFIAMNKRGQRETGGMLGDFCVKCHAPMAVREGATHDGLNLAQVPQHLKGVTCFFCHTVDAVTDSHNNPLHLAEDGVTMFGEYSDPFKNDAHHAKYSVLHDRDRVESASLCGSCHDIVTPQGAAIERTFQEWHESVFSTMLGTSCTQCHMHETMGTTIAKDVPGVPGNRNYHGHMFEAIDTALVDFPEKQAQEDAVKAFLKTELASALCVIKYPAQNESAIRVVLDNLAAGHAFPSGSAQDRRLWIEVIAYDATGNVIYSSGVVPPGQSPTVNPDPDRWLLRDCMLDQAGQPVSMFWQAASVEMPTNLLPGQLTFNQTNPDFYKSHIVQYFPRNETMHFSGIPERVRLRVRLQPVGLDVIDELIASGDLDASFRSKMPTYDLDLNPSAPGPSPYLEWTMAAAKVGWLEEDQVTPAYCVTLTGLNLLTRTPTSNHTQCQP